MRRLSFVMSLALLASCDESRYSPDPPTTIGGARPAAVYRPSDYEPGRAYPLVVLLHGYGVNGAIQDIVFGTSARVDTTRFLLVVPDGTMSEEGRLGWSSSDTCCGTSGIDDVAYVRGLVDEMTRLYHVDEGRVYALGHSNGGAMTYRLACEAGDRFVAIASLAGAAPPTEADCAAPVDPVSVLEVHGTADGVVLYDGAAVASPPLTDPYPSAPEAVRRFAVRLGCDESAPSTPEAIDFDAFVDGAETSITRYETGCVAGTHAELWRIEGSGHIPLLAEDATDRMLTWLFAHER